MEPRLSPQLQFGATTFTNAIKRQILPEAEPFEDSLEAPFQDCVTAVGYMLYSSQQSYSFLELELVLYLGERGGDMIIIGTAVVMLSSK